VALVIDAYLNNLTADYFGASSTASQATFTQNQGIWIQSGREVLGSHQGYSPLSAASLTKVATTLVALAHWGGDHQFETLVKATGAIENGVLQGDLIIQGGGDPFFVWEEAIALGNALNQAGINQVSGDLIITGDFAMNYESNPFVAGSLLRQALNSDIWSSDILIQHQAMAPDTPQPKVIIQGVVAALTPQEVEALAANDVIRHRSLTLTQILKRMNVYSNNFMSEMIADALGGAEQLSQTAAELAAVPTEEVQLINGSGLGTENRISPRATCAMFAAIQGYLYPQQLTVADLFPVVGRDIGTLRGRELPRHTAVKTGTLATVSSLAGIMPMGDRDAVCFAILNWGSDLEGLRASQDELLQQLSQLASPATHIPAVLQPSATMKVGDRLGDPERNQRLM
jgi:D-alanyl-D-alanine carboxypeptidase/D-alanyl-D-alanine-endopeptidase (penicillin-binding protein 4)